jgi:hypothetical protein
MGIASKLSGHWTDGQMIDHLYGVGPEDDHLAACEQCSARLSTLEANRRRVEENAPAGDELSSDFLAAQRRKIYARMEQRGGWRSRGQVFRWASAAAAITVVGGGLAVLQETHPVSILSPSGQAQKASAQVSDAQLAEEVSVLADNSEPQPTQPLQALFSE